MFNSFQKLGSIGVLAASWMQGQFLPYYILCHTGLYQNWSQVTNVVEFSLNLLDIIFRSSLKRGSIWIFDFEKHLQAIEISIKAAKQVLFQ